MQLITDANYHSDTSHISKSGLDKINKSPATYYNYYLNEELIRLRDNQTTREQFIGQVFHTCLLEPHKLLKRYLVLPIKVDRRTKEGKALWHKYMIAAKGKELVNRDVYDIAIAMVKSVQRHPIARNLFKTGIAEEIITFTEPETGIKCKIRPDWRTPSKLLVDLKSALDASCNFISETSSFDDFGRVIPGEINGMPFTDKRFKGFPKSVFEYRYDLQNAFYFDGYSIAKKERPAGFLFVAVEKKEPYEVAVYELDKPIVDNAREQYLRDLKLYKYSKETNHWPGYHPKIIRIT